MADMGRISSGLDASEFVAMLAEGGAVIGKIAQLRFSDGVLIETLDGAEALRRTAELITRDRVMIFEAAFLHGTLFARADILVKDGDGETPNGFRECCGPLADESPHLFDLFQLYSLRNGGWPTRMIAAGRTALDVLREEEIDGPFAERQKIQRRHQIAGTEWIGEKLAGVIGGLARPWHFIDFEMAAPSLPFFAGMRPTETVAFQWSCHTLTEGNIGMTLAHREWLQTEDAYPNLDFARSLLEAVGDEGTVFTWTNHERNVLNETARAIRSRFPRESALADRIGGLVSRLVDQCEICRQHYFHPAMGGSNSLKAVLPAVWSAGDREFRGHPWFRVCESADGGDPVDPHTLLPPLDLNGDGDATVVKEGAGAIRAYAAMLYGPVAERLVWRRLLLQYCQLDTLAMVIVWKYWQERCGEPRVIPSVATRQPR